MRRRPVVAVLVGEAANDGQQMHDLGVIGHFLADRQTGQRGVDGAVWPAYSSGASGVISNVSSCDGPPCCQIRMTERWLADFADWLSARRRSDRLSPNATRAPT
jgi:hypothetical protein